MDYFLVRNGKCIVCNQSANQQWAGQMTNDSVAAPRSSSQFFGKIWLVYSLLAMSNCKLHHKSKRRGGITWCGQFAGLKDWRGSTPFQSRNDILNAYVVSSTACSIQPTFFSGLLSSQTQRFRGKNSKLILQPAHMFYVQMAQWLDSSQHFNTVLNVKHWNNQSYREKKWRYF